MIIEGACHCGKITYKAEINPEQIFICHCTDCQTLSGSAFRTIALAIESNFNLLTGDPKIYVKTVENGSKRAQAFCSDCGTPIYSAPSGNGSSGLLGIRVGTIRQRNQLDPKYQIWCRSTQHWTQEIEKTPKFEKNRSACN